MHILESFIEELKNDDDLKRIQLLKRVDDEISTYKSN